MSEKLEEDARLSLPFCHLDQLITTSVQPLHYLFLTQNILVTIEVVLQVLHCLREVLSRLVYSSIPSWKLETKVQIKNIQHSKTIACVEGSISIVPCISLFKIASKF